MTVVTSTVAHKLHQRQAILCEIFKVKSVQVCVRAHAQDLLHLLIEVGSH